MYNICFAYSQLFGDFFSPLIFVYIKTVILFIVAGFDYITVTDYQSECNRNKISMNKALSALPDRKSVV